MMILELIGVGAALLALIIVGVYGLIGSERMRAPRQLGIAIRVTSPPAIEYAPSIKSVVTAKIDPIDETLRKIDEILQSIQPGSRPNR